MSDEKIYDAFWRGAPERAESAVRSNWPQKSSFRVGGEGVSSRLLFGRRRAQGGRFAVARICREMSCVATRSRWLRYRPASSSMNQGNSEDNVGQNGLVVAA